MHYSACFLLYMIYYDMKRGDFNFFIFLKMKMTSKKHPYYCKSALSW